MIHIHTVLPRITLFTRVVFGLLIVSGWTLVHAERDSLPPEIAALRTYEQDHISRDNDRRLLAALDNHQDEFYAPESGNIFRVKSYWLNGDDMHSLVGTGLEPKLKNLFMQTRADGKQRVRLLIHPESEAMYAEVLHAAERAEDFLATPTSSSRTLFIWPEGKPNDVFFAKVSLDKEIGKLRRTVSDTKVARSNGINNTLHLAHAAGELPSSFVFMPEVFGTIPRSMQEGGMIVRSIPQELREGRVRYVPLFALYATPKSGGSPLLVEMIQRSGLSPQTFIQTHLIRPFVTQWLTLYAMGILPQPHAQNILLEVDARSSLPTGRLIHRDLDGFHIDFSHRRQLNLAEPAQIPFINSFERDYKKITKNDMASKLEDFFYGGFVFNLDQQLPKWVEDGLISSMEPITTNTFRQMLARELEAQFQQQTGKTVALKDNFKRLAKMHRDRNQLLPPAMKPIAPPPSSNVPLRTMSVFRRGIHNGSRIAAQRFMQFYRHYNYGQNAPSRRK